MRDLHNILTKFKEISTLKLAITAIFLVIILISFFLKAINNSQFWGYKDGSDCVHQNEKILKLEDARQVLVQACIFGYEEPLDYDYETIKAGRCVVRNASNLYTIYSSLEVFSKCTGDDVALYNAWKSNLLSMSRYRELEEERIASIRRHIEMRMALDRLNNQ